MAEKNPAVKAEKSAEKPPRCVGVKKGMAPKKFFIIWASFLITLSLGLIVVAGVHHLGSGSGEEVTESPSVKPPLSPIQEKPRVDVLRVAVQPKCWSDWVRVNPGDRVVIDNPAGWVESQDWNGELDYANDQKSKWAGVRSSTFRIRGAAGIAVVSVERKAP